MTQDSQDNAVSLRSVADFPSEGMHLLFIKNIASLRPCLCCFILEFFSNLNTHFSHSYDLIKSYPARYVVDGFLFSLTPETPCREYIRNQRLWVKAYHLPRDCREATCPP